LGKELSLSSLSRESNNNDVRVRMRTKEVRIWQSAEITLGQRMME
jgi:hypothetical protein